MDPFTVSDSEMAAVIADFLDQGHLDTITSLCRAQPAMLPLAAGCLADERYMVRLGVVVLFEELRAAGAGGLEAAVPVLAAMATDAKTPVWARGEAATVLGIIGGDAAEDVLRTLARDRDEQLAEIAALALADT